MLKDISMNELTYLVKTERVMFSWYLALISDILLLIHKGVGYVVDDDGSNGRSVRTGRKAV